MMKRMGVAIEAWPSPGCDTAWSVSEVDDEADEVRCLGGADDRNAAWEQACAEGRKRGVPARLRDRAGDVVEEY